MHQPKKDPSQPTTSPPPQPPLLNARPAIESTSIAGLSISTAHNLFLRREAPYPLGHTSYDALAYGWPSCTPRSQLQKRSSKRHNSTLGLLKCVISSLQAPSLPSSCSQYSGQAPLAPLGVDTCDGNLPCGMCGLSMDRLGPHTLCCMTGSHAIGTQHYELLMSWCPMGPATNHAICRTLPESTPLGRPTGQCFQLTHQQTCSPTDGSQACCGRHLLPLVFLKPREGSAVKLAALRVSAAKECDSELVFALVFANMARTPCSVAADLVPISWHTGLRIQELPELR